MQLSPFNPMNLRNRIDIDRSWPLVALAVACIGAVIAGSLEPWAWAAFGAMALCALIGLADWFMFAPPDRTIPPGEAGTVERLGWGVRVVGVAGPLGAMITWLIARRLNRDDF